MEGRCVLAMCLMFACAIALAEGAKHRPIIRSLNSGGDIPRPFYELFPGLGYYKLHNSPETWDDAKDICEKEGAHLAVINSKEEVEVMRELRVRLPGYFGTWEDDDCYVGITDFGSEGTWKTITGQTIYQAGFADWGGTEPNGGTREDCGVLVVKTGKLNDVPCNVRRGFFCEREL